MSPFPFASLATFFVLLCPAFIAARYILSELARSVWVNTQIDQDSKQNKARWLTAVRCAMCVVLRAGSLGTHSGDAAIKIWDIKSCMCLKTFDGHDASVLRLAFCTTGTQLVSTGTLADQSIRAHTSKLQADTSCAYM